ncbi:MAG: hypothetical protein BWX47_02035 [candidate division Hyd24-12 bacterium ADurb.Bin004]|nr:MAG: hypothetical protein BWX47_02035 [candidate division Hyd24-12 bacterium ADurb.Bin004]
MRNGSSPASIDFGFMPRKVRLNRSQRVKTPILCLPKSAEIIEPGTPQVFSVKGPK